MSDFDPRTIRIGTQMQSDLITAECLLAGCGWRMSFSFGAQRLSTGEDEVRMGQGRVAVRVGPEDAADHLQRVGWENDEPSKYEYMAREEALGKVIKLLAKPYAGREGWREEWRAN